MKSQLLEDIGENTTSSLAPAGTPGQSKAGRLAPDALPAGKPPASGTPQPEEGPPDELNKVFEELAALEAQFVPPGRQHDSGTAAAESGHGRPLAGVVEESGPPPGSAGSPVSRPAEPAPRAAAPREPLFDFTPPAPPTPALQTADPFTPTWPQRSKRGYLPWAAGMLACALLVLGGRWLYQERDVAGTLALVAAGAKDKGGVVRTGPATALSAKEAAPASRPVSAPPPMVLLEPANAASAGEAPAAADQVEPPPPKPAPVARRVAEPAPAKAPRQAARSQSDVESRPARTRHEPVRPLASASTIRKAGTPVRDTSLAATLKACRELGYHATECVKRGCSITQYGLVCRGR